MAEQPHLTIEQGPEAGVEIHITGKSLVLGRDASSDYAIPNEKISRRHLRIFLKDGRWFLEDLESKNHTRLNNLKVEPSKPETLTDGDRIQLAAQVILRFHDPATTVSEAVSRVITNGLWLDRANGEVYVNETKLDPPLSKRHFAILDLLYSKSEGKFPVASLEEISAIGWPGEYGVTPEMIDSEIYRLRQKLAKSEPTHSFIDSVRGSGRKFVQKQ